MIEPLALGVAELAARWKLTQRQVLQHAMGLGVPLYFSFEGLAFSYAYIWLSERGAFEERERFASLERSIKTAEAQLRRRARGQLSEWSALTEEEAALAEVENLKATFQDFHIKRPLARLAEEISPIPDVWTAEFTKKYKVEAEGDDLRIFTLDGKPCLIPKGFTNAGQPIKFTASDVWGLLCWYVPDTKAPEVKRMAAMTNYFGPRGTGAGSSTYSKPPGASLASKTDKAPAVPLGLR